MRLLIVAGLFLAAGLVACTSTPLDGAAVTDATVQPVNPALAGGGSSDGKGVGQSTVSQVVVDPLNDPQSVLANRSVFFEYDSFEISAAGRPVVDAHSKYLRAHSNTGIRIEGHADERGGREYNLALGQKRADAVRRALGLLGVPERQMEAVSFGKEKPLALGHDEESWAKNRRADVAYQGR